MIYDGMQFRGDFLWHYSRVKKTTWTNGYIRIRGLCLAYLQKRTRVMFNRCQRSFPHSLGSAPTSHGKIWTNDLFSESIVNALNGSRIYHFFRSILNITTFGSTFDLSIYFGAFLSHRSIPNKFIIQLLDWDPNKITLQRPVSPWKAPMDSRGHVSEARLDSWQWWTPWRSCWAHRSSSGSLFFGFLRGCDSCDSIMGCDSCDFSWDTNHDFDEI